VTTPPPRKTGDGDHGRRRLGPIVDLGRIDAGDRASWGGDPEGAVENLGEVGGPAVLDMVGRDAALVALALAVEDLDEPPWRPRDTGAGPRSPYAVELVHGDQTHQPADGDPGALRSFFQLRRDQAGVGPLRHEEAKDMRQPVDIELGDGARAGGALHAGSRDDEGTFWWIATEMALGTSGSRSFAAVPRLDEL